MSFFVGSRNWTHTQNYSNVNGGMNICNYIGNIQWEHAYWLMNPEYLYSIIQYYTVYVYIYIIYRYNYVYIYTYGYIGDTHFFGEHTQYIYPVGPVGLPTKGDGDGDVVEMDPVRWILISRDMWTFQTF